MATADDLLRVQPHLRSLAGAIVQLADEEFVEQRWIAVVLDARCFAQGGGIIAKLRVELPDGTLGSVDIPSAENRTLRHLADARAEGADRWYGMRLRVTAADECDTSFDYNPNCADDETFFDF
jgi:hypothetical protein